MLHSSHQRHSQISDITPTSSTRLRVLVYEASNDLDQMIEAPQSEALGLPFDIEIVRTLGEAVEHVRTEWFDVVLLEFNMSGASPQLLVERLKDSALTRPTPIVVRSRQPTVEQAVASLTAGAANYLAFDEMDSHEVWTALEAAVVTETPTPRIEEGVLTPQVTELGQCNSENPVEQYALALTHAVLTPLAAVQEFVSLVLDGVTGHISDEQGKHLAFARGGCETIRSSVLRGLDSARFGSGWDSEHSEIGLEKLIGAAWQDACEASKVDLKPLEIASFLRDETVIGDLEYLTELLGDLFRDALSYTGKEGCVGVSVHRDSEVDSDIVVSITTQSISADSNVSEGALRFANERSYRGVKVTQSVGHELEYCIALAPGKMVDVASQTKIAEMV